MSQSKKRRPQPPIHFDDIRVGCVNYVSQVLLKRTIQSAEPTRWWTYNGVERSCWLPQKTKIKAAFATEEETRRLHEELIRAGSTKPPSGWADAWYAISPPRCVNPTVQALSPASCAGNWEEVFDTQKKGTWYEYDINSAYASTLARPLPDSRTCRRVGSIVKNRLGVYCGFWAVGSVVCPPWIGKSRETWLTSEEIEAFDVTPKKITVGLAFERTLDTRPALDLVQERFTDWKKIMQRFWGFWAAKHGARDHTKGNPAGRLLPNPFRDTVLASFITARTRIAVSRYARDARAIYADQVTLPYQIPTSTEIGGWKLKRTIRFEDDPEEKRLVEAYQRSVEEWRIAKGVA